MGVYEDMANDAGYPYGTPENELMAQWIAEQERQEYFKYLERKHWEALQEQYWEALLEITTA